MLLAAAVFRSALVMILDADWGCTVGGVSDTSSGGLVIVALGMGFSGLGSGFGGAGIGLLIVSSLPIVDINI